MKRFKMLVALAVLVMTVAVYFLSAFAVSAGECPVDGLTVTIGLGRDGNNEAFVPCVVRGVIIRYWIIRENGKEEGPFEKRYVNKEGYTLPIGVVIPGVRIRDGCRVSFALILMSGATTEFSYEFTSPPGWWKDEFQKEKVKI